MQQYVTLCTHACRYMYMYVKLHVLLHVYDAHVFSEPKPPPKKAKPEDSDYDGVSHLLQGEIARLRHHFVVDLDPLYHNQSKAVHLICKLGQCLHTSRFVPSRDISLC